MNVMLIRYGELFLKGHNRKFFESTLQKNMANALKNYSCNLRKISGRYELSDYDLMHEKAIIGKLTKIFGLHTLSIAKKIETEYELIKQECAKINLNKKSFRVTTNRASKIFPIKSMQLSAELGGIILEANPDSKVDLHTPEIEVRVDIRENGYTYISTDLIPCAGGMPLGTAGKGMLLLSGGIDSPVAGYYLARRGLVIEAIHFHSYPYTSELARQKVINLAQKMGDYLGKIKMHIVSVTHIQEEINRKCDRDFMITLLRRMMMRISQEIALKNGAGALITGESLGQVASQTLQSINATNAVVNIPVFRPLIGFDKQDIMDVAKRIGTYEISIQPYEDCCTVFLPKNPVTKPKMEKVLKEEEKLNIEELLQKSLDSEEIIEI
ncbi:MAG: tRNA 4-thiouridine(8) synthase ThiI [Clostridia bacterium]|nr:tRNA 4-thiouridine(8) synthase ThiI [Clostridia bacterium]